LNHLKPSISADVQAQAVRDLIHRNVGRRASKFNVSVCPDIIVKGKDAFKVCLTLSLYVYGILISYECSMLKIENYKVQAMQSTMY